MTIILLSVVSTLIIIRHGQSTWNLENRFTGEVDVDLTLEGEREAKRAGDILRGYPIDEAHTSVLKRAIRTLEIVLREIDNPTMPVFKTAALNERNYGNLQGLNKTETEVKYGEKQVELWRRSYDVAPPGGESLRDTRNRVIPYFKERIEQKLETGTNILVVAHGNSLRALMMYLENITPEGIASVNIATGIPRLYEFDPSLHIVKAQYLN